MMGTYISICAKAIQKMDDEQGYPHGLETSILDPQQPQKGTTL